MREGTKSIRIKATRYEARGGAVAGGRSATAPGGATGTQRLPRTGSTTSAPAVAAGLLLATGGLALWVTRYRPRHAGYRPAPRALTHGLPAGALAALDTTMDAARPPELAARLLLAERDALLPILRRTPADAFDRPTVCTGWSVRDVLAHCGSALTRAAEGTLHDFSPEANEADVAERRPWPLEAVVAELERGYGAAAPVITAAGGRLDGIALGEWVHGGDVREPLGVPRAYQSEGVEDALVLLVERSRRHTVPPTRVRLPDRELWLGPAEPAGAPAQAAGTPAEAGAAAELVTDVPTLIRLCSGRRPDPSRFRLAGATPDRYLLFR